MVGVVTAQLLRLQHSVDPNPTFGYYILGKPLAGIFIACSIAVTLLGAFRFWRQQNAMIRGKVHAGGWEILVMMAGSIVVSPYSALRDLIYGDVADSNFSSSYVYCCSCCCLLQISGRRSKKA